MPSRVEAFARRALPMFAALFVAALTCGSSTAAYAATSAAPAPRVILVMATGLVWEDITATSTPTMWQLAQEGAIGNLSARPRFRTAGEPASAYEGALGISSGNWPTPVFAAEGARNSFESVRGTDTANMYRRINGTSMSGHEIAFLGLPAVLRANASSANDSAIGALGQAVIDAGGTTCAIGNSDAGSPASGQKIQRPAAIAAMDARGLVMFGDVSRNMLMPSPESPYGVRTDLAALAKELNACETSMALHGGPALIVLDPGDEYRARRFASQASDAQAVVQRARAVREADDVVLLALKRAHPTDTVIVAVEAPADTLPGRRGLSPVLVSQPGMHGNLTSESTHREGIVANPDITAFVLAALGIDRPVEVIGNRFLVIPTLETPERRMAWLSARNQTAVFVDAVRGSYADTLIQLCIAVFLLAAVLVAAHQQLSVRRVRLAAGVLHAATLILMVMLAAGWVMFLATPSVFSTLQVWASLLGTAAVLALIAGVIWFRYGGRVALAATTLFVFALLLTDQLLGAPLSFTNLVGYAPLLSARYYGIGNEAAGLMVGSALAGLALTLDLVGLDSPVGLSLRRWGIPAVGLLTILGAAAPFLGANVGVAIWGTIGFAVLWARASGRRLTWKHALVALIVTMALVGAFAAADVLGGGEKTHLARSLSSAEQGGLSQLWQIVARKAHTNARLLNLGNWSAMLVAALAFLAFTRLRPAQELTRATAENPALGAAIASGLTAAVAAFLTEDTGVLVSTFILLPVGLSALWVILSGIRAEREVA